MPRRVGSEQASLLARFKAWRQRRREKWAEDMSNRTVAQASDEYRRHARPGAGPEYRDMGGNGSF
jgi:hypothetical protein